MKKYQLRIWYGGTYEDRTVFADRFFNSMPDSSSSGFYSFYYVDELVATYPICRTAIVSIENEEE